MLPLEGLVITRFFLFISYRFLKVNTSMIITMDLLLVISVIDNNRDYDRNLNRNG